MGESSRIYGGRTVTLVIALLLGIFFISGESIAWEGKVVGACDKARQTDRSAAR